MSSVVRRIERVLPLGRQLQEARLSARLKVKELAVRARLSTAAVYAAEGWNGRGRTKTLVKLARVLGLRLRVPNLMALAEDRNLSVAALADLAGVAFDTVRSLLKHPLRGNLRSLERLCAVLGSPLQLVH